MSRQLSTGPYFITTNPGTTHCPRCHRIVLAATVDGLDTLVDTEALTDLGELSALLARRPTFNLIGERLVHRSPERIRNGGPGTVLAGHDCTPTPPEHVDPAHMTAAIFLVQQLLGGRVVADANPNPPF
jgi:hypothetical protein